MHSTSPLGRSKARLFLPAISTQLLFPISIGIVSLLTNVAQAEPELAGFDAEVLRQRGIDPNLASYFNEAPKFTPGMHQIKITVNGASRGRVPARFDEKGALCFDQALLTAAGLVVRKDSSDDESVCGAYLANYPLTDVQLKPDVNEVELLMPSEALVEVPRDTGGFTSGGVAGMLNYEVLGMSNRFNGDTSNNLSINTEAGFNAGDWIVRSNQLYSSSQGVSQITHQDAYAQRTFAGIGSVFQVGQINLTNPVVGGAQVTGIQFSSEKALGQLDTVGRVEGLAQGPARIEVRQLGTLIYTTIVPGGPFVLSNVPRVNQRANLDVTVIEADGVSNTFTVSSAQAGISNPSKGYVAGVGYLRNVEGAEKTPVLSAGWTGGSSATSSFSTGATAATGYSAGGVSLGYQPWTGAQTRFDVLGARASEEGVKGLQTRAAISQTLGKSWALNGAVTFQTEGYRELQESLSTTLENRDNASRTRSQYDAGISWTHPLLGSFSTSYSQGTLFNGGTTSRASTSWGGSFKKASFSITAEHSLGGSNTNGNSVYASISVPFGERRRVRASMRNGNDSQRLGLSMNETVSDTFAYRVGNERNLTNNTQTLSAGVSLLPRYTQLDVGYSGDGGDQNSLTIGARGAVVAHEGGVTASPYAVSDTFGVVKVGDVSGVKINTPSGPAWTDAKGQAVVAQLSAYGRNTVEIEAKSIPRAVDVLDGVADVKAGRGAVERITFGIEVTRRVLLNVTVVGGDALPEGASVTDSQGFPVGQVDNNGQIFLSNALDVKQLWVDGPNMKRCALEFQLPEQIEGEAFYETVSAICRPIPGE